MDLTNLEADVGNRPPRLVIYGAGGIGKTTFAAQAPSVIFGDVEDGLDGINAVKQRLKSWQDVVDFITALHEQDHNFKTIAIDSIDWLERLIHEQVCKEKGVSSLEDIGYGKGYLFAMDLWEQFLRGMTSLRDTKNMTIILIAHDQIKRFDDPLTDGYDRHMLKLHNKAAALVYEWADAVLFAKIKVYTKSEDVGFKKKINKAVDGGRLIYTTEHPAYQAKHRASLALPDELELGWDHFINAIGTREGD